MKDKQDGEQEHYDLNFLSRESWQLELLVSGILLLLLFSSGAWADSIDNYAETWMDRGLSSFFGVLLMGIPVAIEISTICFIFHVLIRGLWIGAIGLRSVSGDIDLDSLHLHRWFDKFLHPYNDSFDHYILRLERLASVIFSFNFLLIFYMFSILLSFSWVSFFTILSGELHWAFGIFAGFLSVALLLNFIDFVSLQRLKRGKFGFVYYPFYRVLNTLNLSFLYRSLHYNFVDSPFTRKIMKGFILFAITAFFLSGFNLSLSPWLSQVNSSSSHAYKTTNYDQDLSEEYVKNTFLSSFENREILKLTTPILQFKSHQNYIFELCPFLEEYNSFSWFSAQNKNGALHFSSQTIKSGEREIEELRNCYIKAKEFSIDGKEVTPRGSFFLFNEDLESPQGLQFIFSLDSINVGLHDLEIKTLYLRQDSVRSRNEHIAFYKVN